MPAFNPRLEWVGMMGLYYLDDRVIGAVDIAEGPGQRLLCISEWSSKFPGNGNTKDALRWLRAQGFTTIVANGVGLIEEFDGSWAGDIATVYWSRMRMAGLVDVLVDDNGQELTGEQLALLGQSAQAESPSPH